MRPKTEIPAELLDERVTHSNILITGFPGFLAGQLLSRLLDHHAPETRIVALVLPSMRVEAGMQLAQIVSDAQRERFEIVEGDITLPQMGLDDATYERLSAEVGVVWHLAALYDLSVDEIPAYKVNVTGTIHVLDFCEACTSFVRLNYVSTCYVSGDRQGVVYEGELDMRQGFKNHYEETKFWAEVEVQRRWDELETVVLRPSIVVGDSYSGKTAKYDGPYYIFDLTLSPPILAPCAERGTRRGRGQPRPGRPRHRDPRLPRVRQRERTYGVSRRRSETDEGKGRVGQGLRDHGTTRAEGLSPLPSGREDPGVEPDRGNGRCAQRGTDILQS